MAENQDFKMDGETLDITKENIAAMKQLFPEIVTDGKVDFEKLRLILGDEIETSDERYNFTWHGKNQAIRLSQTPSMGTLRPCKEDSVNWDTMSSPPPTSARDRFILSFSSVNTRRPTHLSAR